MSIEMSYRRLSSREFENLLNNPQRANKFFGLDIDEEDEEAQDAYYNALKTNPLYLPLYKWWHAVNFLLNNDKSLDIMPKTSPLGNIILGGVNTKWTSSYGNVRCLYQLDVKEIANSLAQLSDTDLRRRLDAEAFNIANIYPGRGCWNQEELEIVWTIFKQLREFFQEASNHNELILISSE